MGMETGFEHGDALSVAGDGRSMNVVLSGPPCQGFSHENE